MILPLSKPALAALTIFTFMGAWRAFLWPLVVTSSSEMQVLPVMLQAFLHATGTQWNLLMAGTLLVLAPMIVVFVVGQRFFVEGIRLGPLKAERGLSRRVGRWVIERAQGSFNRESHATGWPVRMDSFALMPTRIDAAPSMWLAERWKGSSGGSGEKISSSSTGSPPPCPPSALGISTS